jgi:hypothetical protein
MQQREIKWQTVTDANTSTMQHEEKSYFQPNELLWHQIVMEGAEGQVLIARSAGPNPPSHAVEITAQSTNDSLD